eukprot:1157086-Pelagomonas_calceolata.AAC.8
MGAGRSCQSTRLECPQGQVQAIYLIAMPFIVFCSPHGSLHHRYAVSRREPPRHTSCHAVMQRCHVNCCAGGQPTLPLYCAQEEAAKAYDIAVLKGGRKERTNFPPSYYKDG